MGFDLRRGFGRAGLGLVVLAAGCAAAPADEAASASSSVSTGTVSMPTAAGDEEISLGQNSTWTIDRGAAQTYRVVAYGDSIFAGFQRSFGQVARRSAPFVAAEYLAGSWSANVTVVRRAVTGGLAAEVATVVERDKSFMEDPSTRAVYFEMCGNDYLQARKRFAGATGRCDYAELDAAIQTCMTNTEKAMLRINTSATTARQKVVANLYYPGFDADNVAGRCTEPSGERVNMQKAFLPYIARSNWKTCTLAQRYGFGCADAFAEFMGADSDTNGDGRVDVDALRFDPSESEASYVERISVTLRATVRDANRKGVTGAATADYVFSDDVHPTVYGPAISVDAAGHGPPDFSDAQIVNGKNPQWNLVGHERMGWALWQSGSASL